MTATDGLTTLQKGAIIRPCCANPENLVPEKLAHGLIVRVCRECGNRHFEAEAEPGRFGITVR